MTTLSKGQYVRIQTEEPESELNGAWGIVQGYDDDCVMVAVEGLATELNTLPFDHSDLTPISEADAKG